MLDAFLELFEGGSVAVEGECLDGVFGKKKAIQLLSFTLQSQKDMSSGTAPKAKPKTEAEKAKAWEEEQKKAKAKERQMTAEPEPVTSTKAQELFLFTITKEIDSATPHLFLEYCTRWARQVVNWDKAKVTLRKAAGGDPHLEFMVYEFTNVWVKSWSLGDQGGDELPEEEVEFAFDTCKVYYTPQGSSGDSASVKYGGWDFGNHKQL
jgi:type VI protein secretion system component Hcp